eukprot:779157-Prymnesium_polylepis.1
MSRSSVAALSFSPVRYVRHHRRLSAPYPRWPCALSRHGLACVKCRLRTRCGRNACADTA